ncbi:SUMF1/EgtB/PvdO family nonheme iron enzyme [Actinoplanes sp. L3-i22]|uniref:formylglycine-generating enzyme family protein n=1 Tax=Actinoplanes sp. L3-i22 TaxID=2836373 RepID=UPI002105F37E|nr:SUMF1/EgtB/PvdO family nonheme iron enzyme [Actinoplanes sp. L3-i22]
MAWTLVPGGVCRYGDAGRPVLVADLEVTTTPITHMQAGYPGAEPDLPITQITYREATDLAARLGGRLPRSVEWEWLAAGPNRRAYPWGDADADFCRAVLRPTGYRQPVAVGGRPAGATPDGVLDLAGLVWEWTATPVLGDGRIIRGGSYCSPALYARSTFLNAAPQELRSAGIGLRIVRQR